jgi:hypothetical protein
MAPYDDTILLYTFNEKEGNQTEDLSGFGTTPRYLRSGGGNPLADFGRKRAERRGERVMLRWTR